MTDLLKNFNNIMILKTDLPVATVARLLLLLLLL